MIPTKEELFPKIVGQDRAKRRLKFYIDGYRASHVIPHLMFIAPKGCGKTMMAKALGKNLTLKDDPTKPKPFLEINCSTIKSVKQLFNQIIIPHVNQKECTILFDEASELPKDVTMALLTILNPNATNRTSFSVEDYVVDFDFSQQSFIFATTEAQHIFHALMDRCERIDLEEYNYDELGEIVTRVLPEIDFDKDPIKVNRGGYKNMLVNDHPDHGPGLKTLFAERGLDYPENSDAAVRCLMEHDAMQEGVSVEELYPDIMLKDIWDKSNTSLDISECANSGYLISWLMRLARKEHNA